MFLQTTRAIPYVRANLANYDFLEEIEYLPIPYHLMQCELDKDINKTLKTTLMAINKNLRAKVIFLAGVGHIANLDQPDAFNKCLEKIITGLNEK